MSDQHLVRRLERMTDPGRGSQSRSRTPVDRPEPQPYISRIVEEKSVAASIREAGLAEALDRDEKIRGARRQAAGYRLALVASAVMAGVFMVGLLSNVLDPTASQSARNETPVETSPDSPAIEDHPLIADRPEDPTPITPRRTESAPSTPGPDPRHEHQTSELPPRVRRSEPGAPARRISHTEPAESTYPHRAELKQFQLHYAGTSWKIAIEHFAAAAKLQVDILSLPEEPVPANGYGLYTLSGAQEFFNELLKRSEHQLVIDGDVLRLAPLARLPVSGDEPGAVPGTDRPATLDEAFGTMPLPDGVDREEQLRVKHDRERIRAEWLMGAARRAAEAGDAVTARRLTEEAGRIPVAWELFDERPDDLLATLPEAADDVAVSDEVPPRIARSVLPGGKVRYVFHVTDTPWQTVLQEFAELAGLQVRLEAIPRRSLEYVDPAPHSEGESLGILNDFLLQEGYVLVVRGDTLIVTTLHAAGSPLAPTGESASVVDADETSDPEETQSAPETPAAPVSDATEPSSVAPAAE